VSRSEFKESKAAGFLGADYVFGPEANVDFVEGGSRVYSLGLAISAGF
jgi:hypothetical protein